MSPRQCRNAIAVLAAAFLLAPFSESPAQQASRELAAICAGERLAFALPPMSAFDANGNRVVSGQEAAGCETLAFLFSRLDLDASRTLTAEEYEAFPELWRRHARTFREPE